MSLATKAVRGAVWTIGSSIGGRLIGVIGTLIITRYLAPEVVGEVSVASVLVLTANQLSNLGFGQYVASKPNAGRAATFHATVFCLIFGAAALGIILVLRRPLAPLFDAPDVVHYLPGLVLAVAMDRLAFIPQRVLVRDMRFGTVSVARTTADVSFTVTAVGLAVAGWGGESLIVANIVRSFVRSAIFIARVNWRDWLLPHRLDRAISRDIFRFGVPMSIAASSNFASMQWDNLLFAGIFGPAQMGMYNLAYNLADIPASHVGEHIGDVLLPSFAHMDAEGRLGALKRSTALLALLVFPLAVGLGAISKTLVATLLNANWQGVAPFLAVLSPLSVVRPIGWTIQSYLQARDMPRSVMVLEIGKVLALLATIPVFGMVGPLWACGAVGLSFALHALASMWMIQHHDGLPIGALIGGMTGPLAACGVMAAAVLALRFGLADFGSLPLELAAEIVVGALSYVAAAFALAPATAHDFIDLLRRSFFRRSTAPVDD